MIKKLKHQKNNQGVIPLLILLVIVVAAVAGGSYLLYKKNVQTRQKTSLPRVTQSSKGKFPAVSLKKRSMAPGVVKSATVARKVDKTGKAIDVVSQFSSKDPNNTGVYVSLELNNSQQGQRLAYVRYYYNSTKKRYQYIDYETVPIKKPSIKYTYFRFYTKSGAGKRRPGEYLVKVYTNGRFEKSVLYKLV